MSTPTWKTTGPIYGQPISIDQIVSLGHSILLHTGSHPNHGASDMDTLLLCTDQDHWQSRATDVHSAYRINNVHMGTYLDQFVAVGMGLNPADNSFALCVLTSPNGIDWIPVHTQPLTSLPWILDLRSTNDGLIVVCLNKVYLTQDLIEWSTLDLPQDLMQNQHLIVDANILNNTLVILSRNDTEYTLTNIDLATKETTQTPSLIPAHSIRTSASQILLLSDSRALYSDDLKTWNTLQGLARNTWRQGQLFNDAIYTNNKWHLAWTAYTDGIQDGHEILIAQHSGLLISDNPNLTRDTLYSDTTCPLKQISKLAAYNDTILAINTQVVNPDQFVAIYS